MRVNYSISTVKFISLSQSREIVEQISHTKSYYSLSVAISSTHSDISLSVRGSLLAWRLRLSTLSSRPRRLPKRITQRQTYRRNPFQRRVFPVKDQSLRISRPNSWRLYVFFLYLERTNDARRNRPYIISLCYTFILY